MATANEVIKTALKKLTVLGQVAPLQSEDAEDARLELNDMMSEWAASGIALGFTKVLTLSDTVTVPDPTLAAIKNQLALRMQPYYPSTQLTAEFVKAANDSYQNLLNQIVQKTTLTMFPEDVEGETLTEQNAIIVVEDGT